MIDAVVGSWSAAGGDLDVGGKLPALFEAAGLRVVHLEPRVFCARPGTPRWEWPRSFFRGFLPQLVQKGRLSQDDADAFEDAMAEAERTPGSYLLTPPVVTIVAERRG